MEGFAEYNYATVSDENAKELEKLVNKVTEKVPKINLDNKKNEKAAQAEGDDVGTSDKAENPDADKPQDENDLSISFGKLFNSVKKKSEEISEIYKKDFSDLYENVKQDATYAGTTLNSTWSKLSSNLQENYQKFQAQATNKEAPEVSETGEEQTREAPAKQATSGFFSSFNADKLFQRTELNRLTQGFNSFIKQVIEVEAPEASTKSEKRIATDRRETQILALQSNTSTFVDDPLEDDKYHEAYINFSEKFDLETHQEQINHLLRSSTQLEKIHGRLVPNVIDNGIFWCRYFFHVRQLDLMEAKRKEAAEGALSSNEEIYSWGEDQQDEEEEPNHNDSNLSQTESKSSQRSESGADPSSHTDSYDMVSSGNEEPENTISSPKEENASEEGEAGEEDAAEEHKEEGDDDWGVWE